MPTALATARRLARTACHQIDSFDSCPDCPTWCSAGHRLPHVDGDCPQCQIEDATPYIPHPDDPF